MTPATPIICWTFAALLSLLFILLLFILIRPARIHSTVGYTGKLLPLYIKDNPAADFNPWRKSRHITERRYLKYQLLINQSGGRHLFDCLISKIAAIYLTSLLSSINWIQNNGLISYKIFPFFPKGEAPFSTGFPRLRPEKNDTILTSNSALSGQNPLLSVLDL